MADARHWTGDDERDLTRTPRTPEQSFRRHWTYAKAKGPREIAEFLAIYDGLVIFQHLVDECREEIAEQTKGLVRLDVEAGELVE